jgi:hypothetical protein
MHGFESLLILPVGAVPRHSSDILDHLRALGGKSIPFVLQKRGLRTLRKFYRLAQQFGEQIETLPTSHVKMVQRQVL